MKVTEKALALLQKVVALEGWYVCADNIVEAGVLVGAGYARCYDDYEGPRLALTDAGIAYALRRKIVRRRTAEELDQPYTRPFALTGDKWLDELLAPAV